MSFRTDDESSLKALGYIEGADGNYYKPGDPRLKTLNQAKTYQAKETTAVDIRVRDSGQNSVNQRRKGNDGKGKKPTGKKRESKSRSSLSRENETGKRYRIRVTSFRVSDFDSDNLTPKYEIDQLWKEGIIPEDSSKYVDCTSKWVVPVATPEEERTLVEVYEYDYP